MNGAGVTARLVARTGAGLALVVAVAGISFAWGHEGADGLGVFGPVSAARILSHCAYALVGGFVAARRPANPVGWIFLAGGAAMTLQLGLEEYAQRAIVLEPGEWPAAVVADWLAEWLWILPLAALQFSMLLFPDGGLPSRRWRHVARVLVAGDLALLVLAPLATWPLRGQLAAGEVLLDSPLWSVIQPLAMAMVAATLLCAASLVARYRGAGTQQRHQLRWLALAAGAFVAGTAIENVFGGTSVTGPTNTAAWPYMVGVLGTAALPVAAAMAILKRRLYDIDRLISRLLVYTVVTALLVGAYLASVLLLGRAARAVTGESGDLVVALSTLAVAAAARPLLERVRAAVDRRFNRARYDAARTVDAFGRSLRDEVSRDAVVDALRSTTAQTFEPEAVGVLLTGATAGGRR